MSPFSRSLVLLLFLAPSAHAADLSDFQLDVVLTPPIVRAGGSGVIEFRIQNLSDTPATPVVSGDIGLWVMLPLETRFEGTPEGCRISIDASVAAHPLPIIMFVVPENDVLPGQTSTCSVPFTVEPDLPRLLEVEWRLRLFGVVLDREFSVVAVPAPLSVPAMSPLGIVVLAGLFVTFALLGGLRRRFT